MTLLRELRASSKSDCIVLFATNYESYVTDGFYYSAFQYFVKPVDPQKFMSEIRRAIEKFKQDHLKLPIVTKDGRFTIDYYELFYIESQKRILTYHTAKDYYQTYDTLARLESLLSPYGFLRCHKSYLVNMEKIIRWNNYSFHLSDGSVVDISRHKRSKILAVFYEYQRGRLLR